MRPLRVFDYRQYCTPVSSEQAVAAVRIKTLFNLPLNGVGEFAARAVEIARDFMLGLLQSRRFSAGTRGNLGQVTSI